MRRLFNSLLQTIEPVSSYGNTAILLRWLRMTVVFGRANGGPSF